MPSCTLADNLIICSFNATFHCKYLCVFCYIFFTDMLLSGLFWHMQALCCRFPALSYTFYVGSYFIDATYYGFCIRVSASKCFVSWEEQLLCRVGNKDFAKSRRWHLEKSRPRFKHKSLHPNFCCDFGNTAIMSVSMCYAWIYTKCHSNYSGSLLYLQTYQEPN